LPQRRRRRINYLLEQFARVLSRELGERNVTVNVLSPGYTEADMLNQGAEELGAVKVRVEGARHSPFNCIGTSEEVADVARFLTVMPHDG
jgi:3-oxoacyl-[acyl-carrier protein] reductase